MMSRVEIEHACRQGEVNAIAKYRHAELKLNHRARVHCKRRLRRSEFARASPATTPPADPTLEIATVSTTVNPAPSTGTTETVVLTDFHTSLKPESKSSLRTGKRVGHPENVEEAQH